MAEKKTQSKLDPVSIGDAARKALDAEKKDDVLKDAYSQLATAADRLAFLEADRESHS